MAKIITKGFEELLVTEEKAQALYEFLEEKKDEKEGLGLSAYPVTIETTDGGLWIGNLSNIGQIFINEKTKVRKNDFKSDETLRDFHQKYGYGGNQSRYEPGYGLLDVQTQFLIGTGQARIEGRNLIRIPISKEKQEYWDDLWYVYTNEKLDPFGELVTEEDWN